MKYEINNTICEISSYAIGLDALPIKFVKCILPILLQAFHYMFNVFISTGVSPKAWQLSKLTSLRKKANCNSIDC